MSSNPRFINAFNAMETLGISKEEVKPVLRNLLELFDENWELIEDDNYRALIDAYFESKEDKQEEHKRKAPISCHDNQRPKQKRHLDNQVSSADNSRRVLSVEETGIPPKTVKQETMKPSQISRQDMKSATSSHQRRLSDEKRISSLPYMTARDRKSYLVAAPSAGHHEDPIDEPSNPCIQRKNMSSDHYQKKLITSGTEKPKFQSVSTSYNGLPDASNGNHSIKSLTEVYQNTHKIEDGPTCNNNTRTSKGNIDIASSPLGEVKISLNCDAAFRQPNFHIPNLDRVMKYVEEKYLRTFKTVEPQLSVAKLLDDLCRSVLKMGSNLNRKGSKQAPAEDKKKTFRYVDDITKGSENVKISLLDETDSEGFPKFNYIPSNIMYQNANVNIALARIADQGCCAGCSGDCLSLPFPCACSQDTGGEFAYSSQGLLKEKFLKDCMSMLMEPQDHHYVYCNECPIERSKNETKPEPCKGHLVRKFIKECWRKCGCDMKCGNRVVQRGISRKLQVFLTEEGKGWGVRPLEDLPKGSFVCEYAGEILTNTELYERIVQSTGNDRHTYPVTLDADWGSEVGLQDEEALCLDATHNGNVARFINHSSIT
ncbi:hypothetical protein TSUD_33740 [Trifolium subterraneum]|uniref:SET domain-containing protein n=1 Tax=Trifolium subterraneum TaxID=3900 RepID=A0A2Z6MYE3_TRISU|nr:hypothetical protein TSUD_33740 [Trifolium subterraneum]